MHRNAGEEFATPPATGLPRVCLEFSFGLHSRQNLSEWNGCETRSVVGQAIGNDQHAMVDQSAARIDNVRYVAFTLILIGLQQGLSESPDHLGRILAIEKKRTDAVLSHRPDAVAKHQPS